MRGNHVEWNVITPERPLTRRMDRDNALFQLRACRGCLPAVVWTAKDVWAYAKANDIPLMPLYDLGYTSIGCEPCTALPDDPSNPRSGRWQGKKLECGIHIQAK